METIERLKYVLNKGIHRTFNHPNSSVLCLHTTSAVIDVVYWFPELKYEEVLEIVSKNIKIKPGRLTSFIWGYSDCAREINNLIKTK